MIFWMIETTFLEPLSSMYAIIITFKNCWDEIDNDTDIANNIKIETEI